MATRLHTPVFKSAQSLRHPIGLYRSFAYIADRRTNTGDGVDCGGVQASKVVGQSVLNIESPPISLSRRAIDEKHNAERDRVRDRKTECNEDQPRPAFAICTFYQPAVKEQNRYFRASSADQK